MPRAGLDTIAVVSAAAELADADGLDALTLARLADRLGVRSPSLYAHLGGLDDLRNRVAARGAFELAAALRTAAVGKSGRDALAAVAVAYHAYAREHPGSYQALQRAAYFTDDPTAARELIEIVGAVLDGYGIRGDAAIHATRIIRAALHGFVTLEVEGGFGMPLDLDDTFARLVSTLDRGLTGSK
jgi:AcrR family transcriptional regulator